MQRGDEPLLSPLTLPRFHLPLHDAPEFFRELAILLTDRDNLGAKGGHRQFALRLLRPCAVNEIEQLLPVPVCNLPEGMVRLSFDLIGHTRSLLVCAR